MRTAQVVADAYAAAAQWHENEAAKMRRDLARCEAESIEGNGRVIDSGHMARLRAEVPVHTRSARMFRRWEKKSTRAAAPAPEGEG